MDTSARRDGTLPSRQDGKRRYISLFDRWIDRLILKRIYVWMEGVPPHYPLPQVRGVVSRRAEINLLLGARMAYVVIWKKIPIDENTDWKLNRYMDGWRGRPLAAPTRRYAASKSDRAIHKIKQLKLRYTTKPETNIFLDSAKHSPRATKTFSTFRVPPSPFLIPIGEGWWSQACRDRTSPGCWDGIRRCMNSLFDKKIDRLIHKRIYGWMDRGVTPLPLLVGEMW